MVQDDDVHAALAERGNGGDRGGATVHSKQEVGGVLGEAFVHGVLAEAVAFVHAMGEVIVSLPAERPEDLEEEGGRSHAVHVVVAEDDYGFIAVAGLQKAFDGQADVGEEKRVGELLEAGLKEGRAGGGLSQAAV